LSGALVSSAASEIHRRLAQPPQQILEFSVMISSLLHVLTTRLEFQDRFQRDIRIEIVCPEPLRIEELRLVFLT
jgi:hypothetical protein